MKRFVDIVVQRLNELAELLERYPDLNNYYVLRSPSAVLIDAFEKFRKFFDLELSAVIRSWDLIEDQSDIIILASGTRADQVEAAKRLAKQLLQPALLSIRLRNEARRLNMPETQLIDEILFPDGLMVAMAKMDEPQKVRLRRTWVVDQNGKIWVLRPARDLTVATFLRLLHREASKASRAILLDQPYPSDDALNWQQATDGRSADHGYAYDQKNKDDDNGVLEKLDQASFRRLGCKKGRTLLITAEEDPTRNEVIAIEAKKQAEKDLFLLLKNASVKEQAR
jgi:hypothetical protein